VFGFLIYLLIIVWFDYEKTSYKMLSVFKDEKFGAENKTLQG